MFFPGEMKCTTKPHKVVEGIMEENETVSYTYACKHLMLQPYKHKQPYTLLVGLPEQVLCGPGMLFLDLPSLTL